MILTALRITGSEREFEGIFAIKFAIGASLPIWSLFFMSY